jgi:uncharacterized membrane protein YebE (DUF533 family)
MSVLSTLAKVAIGVAAAKGVGYALQQRNAKQTGGAPGDGGIGDLGGLFGNAPAAPQARVQPANQSSAPQGGGLEDILSSVLGGQGQAGGGLGGVLEQLSKSMGGAAGAPGAGAGAGARPGASAAGGAGGLDQIIGALAGAVAGGAGGKGGLGDLLGGLLQGQGGSAQAAPAGKPPQQGGSFADILNQALSNGGEPDVQPTPEQDVAAALMLRAMIQAAKSDGKIDENEKRKLLGKLGDATPAEMDFVNRELAAPVDPEGLARQVPAGLGAQVYAFSVLAIDLDSPAEAKYLDRLAKGLQLSPQQVNAVHQQLGVPALYS